MTLAYKAILLLLLSNSLNREVSQRLSTEKQKHRVWGITTRLIIMYDISHLIIKTQLLGYETDYLLSSQESQDILLGVQINLSSYKMLRYTSYFTLIASVQSVACGNQLLRCVAFDNIAGQINYSLSPFSYKLSWKLKGRRKKSLKKFSMDLFALTTFMPV